MQQCLLELTIKKLLENYSKIWEKIGKLLNIESESKPVYGDDGKYIKTKKKNTCRQYDFKFS